jgi:hypothetical protein
MAVTVTLGASTLANGAADPRQSPEGFRVVVQNVVQPRRAIRSAVEEQIPRALTRTVVSFGNSIEHASVDLALEACSSAAAALAQSGDLVIANTGGTSRKMVNAALVDHEHWHVGVSSYHRYQISGGKLETVVTP